MAEERTQFDLLHDHDGLNSQNISGNNSVNFINSNTGRINISQSDAPAPGQVLTALDATHATWQGGGNVMSFDNTSSTAGVDGAYNQPLGYSLAGNLLLLLICTVDGETFTTPQYNGITMSLITSVATGGVVSYLYYLRSPALGNNNITTTFSGGSPNFQGMIWASYNNCNVTSQPDNSASSTASGTSYSQSLTPVKDYCWLVMGGAYLSNLTITQGTGTVVRKVQGFGVGGTARGAYLCDSATFIHPARSTALLLTSASQTFEGVIASIAIL